MPDGAPSNENTRADEPGRPEARPRARTLDHTTANGRDYWVARSSDRTGNHVVLIDDAKTLVLER